jgi:PAS domain S-box-containing protein
MTYEGESFESLRERLDKLEAELKRKDEHISRLDKANRDLQQKVQDAPGQVSGEISEIDETLKRLLTRVAMIVQGGKCLFMVHDKENDELFADTPAIGFDDVDLTKIRVKADQGLSGEVFRTNEPTVLFDSETDERAQAEKFSEIGVRNGVAVPLIIEKRDEETNKVLERKTIGVLHVFNKRFGGIFIDEDIQLLSRLARNVAAVINSAEFVKQIVKEKEEAVSTIQSLSMGLIMVNRNERITQMNTSAMRIFGLKREDLTGGKTYEAVIKDETIKELIRKALNAETEDGAEIQLPDPENPEATHYFQVQTATVRSEAGDTIGTAAILNDITEIKNVDKLRSAFVSTVSHELRTPLTSIKGFVATLLGDPEEDFYDKAMRHEFYTIINDECDRLKRLIDDMLNVARIDSGKTVEMNFGEVNVPKLVDKVMVIENGSTNKKPNHTLHSEVDPAVPELIEADGDKVEQIFHNLISNALKYSPNGGEVRVVVKMMSDDLIQVAISDQGIGIPEDQLAKMFQRFHRVDNRDTRTVGGTGIGLFLTKSLVESHGGRIWLDSVYGKGTTFYFTLPVKQEEEVRSAPNLA